jgi:hypothetical protein
LCSNCDQYWDVQTDGTNAYVATSGNAAGAFSLATGAPAWPTIRGTGDFQAAWVPGDGRVYYGGHFGEGVWSSGQPQNQVPAKQLVAVFTRTVMSTVLVAEADRGLPRHLGVHLHAGSLWVGGDFTGEEVNGTNNHKPYLAAYPDPNVVTDTQPPTGKFDTDRATAWAKLTEVTLVQTAIHDNVTPDKKIARTVDWGDGTSADWASGTTPDPRLQVRWRIHPAGHADRPGGQQLRPDRVLGRHREGRLGRPRREARPAAARALRRGVEDAARHRHRRGHRRQVGLAEGRREAWQAWYGYHAKTHRWVKAATKAKAFAKSTRVTAKIGAQHTWAAKLAHLHQGTLVYKVWATDQVTNRSATVTHHASLTRR